MLGTESVNPIGNNGTKILVNSNHRQLQNHQIDEPPKYEDLFGKTPYQTST